MSMQACTSVLDLDKTLCVSNNWIFPPKLIKCFMQNIIIPYELCLAW